MTHMNTTLSTDSMALVKKQLHMMKSVGKPPTSRDFHGSSVSSSLSKMESANSAG